MNCQEIREQLDAALDDQCVISSRIDESQYAEVISHVESCAHCRVLYDDHLVIGSALAMWAHRRPVVDLTDRVIEAARQEGLVSSNGLVEVGRADVRVARLDPGDDSEARDELLRRLPARRSILPAIVTVALVLAAVAIVFRGKPGGIVKKEDWQEQSIPDRQPDLFENPQDQVADVGHLVADAQSAWRGITSRVSHQASSFSVFVPDLNSGLGISGNEDSAVQPGNTDGDSGPQELSEPSAVEKAFEFLFKDDDSSGTLTI